MEMQSTEDTGKPRAVLACSSCRALKVRCLPSIQSGQCQKCLKANKECIFDSPRPRRRRPNDAKAHVAIMETKLDGLISLLGQSQNIQNVIPKLRAPDKEVTSIQPNSDNVCEYDTPLKVLHDAPQDRISEPHADFTSLEALRIPEVETTDASSFFTHSVLTYERATALLSIFRNMSIYFPFVLLPTEYNIESLSEERPFLFLAMMATASSEDKPLQEILDRELRTMLSTKVILEGEKSIDLLQGLLVYLAWYHFHFIPRSQQSYQFLQIAVGMTIDLGLDQRPWRVKSQMFGVELSHYDSASDPSESHEYYSKDARRCYLGCYYLSTGFAIGVKKPNNLKYSEYMIQCCMSLREDIEHPADAYLLYLIQLQRLAEEIYETFHLEKLSSNTEMELLRLQKAVKAFNTRLQAWKASLPSDIRISPLIESSYHAVNIDVHEMGLLYCSSAIRRTSNSTLAAGCSQTHKSFICLNILFTCLEATKSYFESFLSLPVQHYRYISYIELGRLIFATFVLYKLCLGPSTVPEWDVHVARKTANIEIYLESLCYRLQHINVGNPKDPQKVDLFSLLKLIFENVKMTYQRLKVREEPIEGIDDTAPHLSFVRAPKAPTRPKRLFCPAFPYWKPKPSEGLGNSGDDFFGNSCDIGNMELPEDPNFWNSIMNDAPNVDESL